MDPQIEAMLQNLAAEKRNLPKKITLEQSREIYRRQYLSMSRRPEEAVAEEVVSLTGDAEVRLTLYRPPSLPARAAIVLYLHGGGFVLGDSSAYASQSARIALHCNATVAFLDYRLAPEHPFPAAYEDTLSAVRWLKDNIDRLNLDPERFAVMGDSAGGNLAIAAMRHHRGKDVFCHGVLLYPVADLRPYAGMAAFSASDEAFAAGYYLERLAMEYFARSYLPQPALALDPRVSPILADDLTGLPPITIYGGEIDLLRDQGRQFAEHLIAAGVSARYFLLDGLIHNFMQHSGISVKSDEAFLRVCADLRAALDRSGS
ncbi:alpha/beta hydrolase fold domain-containing protein [Neorhizobium sp. DT-125]|uniref:alpha/beta hydrolase n=1 Tax=Neorhizobium sp. DT-125 TaxID=3396163 RepID=UPI003F1ACBAE